MTPDGTPVIGATRYANLYLNTGHGTLGWTMACGSARVWRIWCRATSRTSTPPTSESAATRHNTTAVRRLRARLLLQRQRFLQRQAFLHTQIEVGLDVIDVMHHQAMGLFSIAGFQRIENGGVIAMAAA